MFNVTWTNRRDVCYRNTDVASQRIMSEPLCPGIWTAALQPVTFLPWFLVSARLKPAHPHKEISVVQHWTPVPRSCAVVLFHFVLKIELCHPFYVILHREGFVCLQFLDSADSAENLSSWGRFIVVSLTWPVIWCYQIREATEQFTVVQKMSQLSLELMAWKNLQGTN